MNSQERRVDKLQRLTNKLKNKADSGIPILVEGPRDIQSLQRIGVDGEIICVKSTRGTLNDLLYRLREKRETVVLTDFDREGDELAARITRELTFLKVKPDRTTRSHFKSLLKNEIKAIQELAGYYEKNNLLI